MIAVIHKRLIGILCDLDPPGLPEGSGIIPAEIVQINLQDESPLMKPATASDKIIVRKNDIEIELPMTCEAIESVIKGLVSC